MTQVSSLYLHVPFCQHLCNYCDFYKRKLDLSQNQFEDFHQFLLLSHERHKKLLQTHQVEFTQLETVYLGGGTPSLWGKRGAEFFPKLNFSLLPDAEFTMEIDPGTWNDDLLLNWKERGLNRISIGTQSLDPEFLKILDRVHTLEDSLLFLEKMKKENWNFSLDFLLGVPFSRERKRNIQKELDLLLEHSPKHISLYILNARSKYPHIQKIPDDEYVRDEYLFVSDYLRAKGFHHYEVSNFALPGFESRHNMKYWEGKSVAAMGPTGTGYFSLNSKEAIRYKWKVSSPEVEVENLGEAELSLEETYLSLRTSAGWKPENPTEKLLQTFESWVTKGHGSLNEGRMILSAEGFLMLDSLMDDLFRI